MGLVQGGYPVYILVMTKTYHISKVIGFFGNMESFV